MSLEEILKYKALVLDLIRLIFYIVNWLQLIKFILVIHIDLYNKICFDISMIVIDFIIKTTSY